MGLTAGGPNRVDSNYVWIEGSLADTLTKAIDDEMKALYPLLNNNQALPDVGRKDRLLLFAAIARGLLSYLNTHAPELNLDITV